MQTIGWEGEINIEGQRERERWEELSRQHYLEFNRHHPELLGVPTTLTQHVHCCRQEFSNIVGYLYFKDIAFSSFVAQHL